MRKIALLAVVAFAAACGSSSSPTGYLRVANLSPDVAGMDFCITPAGGTISAPVMANSGSATGLLYDVGTAGARAGLKQMSKYFGYAPGTYTVTMMSTALGGSCAAGAALASGSVTLTDGGYKTVALVGSAGAAATGAVPFTVTSFTDEVSVASTSVAIRFANQTLTPTGLSVPAFVAGISWNIGLTIPGGYTPLFTNIAYPGTAEVLVGGKVDVNGYVTLPTSQIPSGSLALFVCPYNFDPSTLPPPNQCGSFTVTSTQITGGIVASAYMIGGVGVTSGTYKQTALFCGDVTSGQIASDGNYSACTAALPQ
jgi:hypothetical protein